MLWNKIANLPETVKPGTLWFDRLLFSHACRAAGSRCQINTFFYDFVWDECEIFV
jgi:hypothetical protein